LHFYFSSGLYQLRLVCLKLCHRFGWAEFLPQSRLECWQFTYTASRENSKAFPSSFEYMMDRRVGLSSGVAKKMTVSHILMNWDELGLI
jgi:hypothetical protein